jgi:hypothetical protein
MHAHHRSSTTHPLLPSNHVDRCCSLIPVTILYLVIGAVVKWKVYGAEPRSLDIIPNIDFWRDLPFLVKVSAPLATSLLLATSLTWMLDTW